MHCLTKLNNFCNVWKNNQKKFIGKYRGGLAHIQFLEETESICWNTNEGKKYRHRYLNKIETSYFNLKDAYIYSNNMLWQTDRWSERRGHLFMKVAKFKTTWYKLNLDGYLRCINV